MAIYQLVLTSILDFFFLSKVTTIWQIDGAAHKLKLRLSRSKKVDLVFYYFLLLFLFLFIFIFSIFRTLGLGLEVICHTVTSVTSDGVVTTLIIGLKKEVEGSGTK